MLDYSQKDANAGSLTFRVISQHNFYSLSCPLTPEKKPQVPTEYRNKDGNKYCHSVPRKTGQYKSYSWISIKASVVRVTAVWTDRQRERKNVWW
jgi:hypothetical protein